MVHIFAEDCHFYATVKKWAAESKWNRDRTEDNPRSACSKTSTPDEQVDAIHQMILDDRCLIVQQIVKSIGITSGLVHTVLTEILGVSKAVCKMIP